MKLGDTIRSLRGANKMTQKELAKYLDISPSTIGMYEQNRRMPDIDTLTKIAYIFDVSIDYLLGKETDSSKSEKQDSRGFFFFFFNHWEDYQKRLSSELLNQNISEENFMEQTGLSIDKEPTIDDLIKISNFLHISIDYLLGISDIKTISTNNTLLNTRESSVIETFRLLNEDNQDIVIGEMKKFLKEQRYESVAADKPSKLTGTDNLGK